MLSAFLKKVNLREDKTADFIQDEDTISNIARRLLPNEPLYIYRMNSLRKASNCFLSNFPGKVLYAIKANPDPVVIRALYDMGINKFDVASLEEIRHIKSLFPDAELYFMHPVKSRESIRKAYYKYGIRNFCLDDENELKKIIEEIREVKNVKLFVRFAVPNSHSNHNMSEKFGANEENAVRLLEKCQAFTKNLGLCFHVGTQCMSAAAYRFGIKLAKQIVTRAKVEIQELDIGGGFPSIYPELAPPSLLSYFEEIKEEFYDSRLNCQLSCEPGRALVAESGSIIVRAQLRKKNLLYINDGIYGNLFDCGGQLGYTFPVKLISPPSYNHPIEEKIPFSFFGPTCDSIDFMKGPLFLPANIKEGDYIEVGQAGAYSTVLKTNFNGFGRENFIKVFTNDPPIISMYE